MAESGFSAGSIFVAFRATVDDFQKGLKSAIDGLKSFGSQVGGIASKVASFGSAVTRAFTAPLRAVGSFISSLATLKTLVVGLIAGKVFDELVTGPARAAVELERMAARAGVAVQQLERLQFVVSAAGGRGEDVSIGLEKLNKILDDTARGATDFIPVLQELGFEGLSINQIIDKIFANPNLSAGGLKKLGIPELAVLAKLSREEIDKLRVSFVRLGNGTDADLRGLGNRLQVVTTKLKEGLGNVAEQVSKLLLPPILKGLEFVEKWMEAHFPEIEGFFNFVQQKLGAIFAAIQKTAEQPQKLVEALQTTAQVVFKAIGDSVIEFSKGVIQVGIKAAVAIFDGIVLIVGPFFKELWGALKIELDVLLEKAQNTVEDWFVDLWDWIKKKAFDVEHWIAQQFIDMVRGFRKGVEGDSLLETLFPLSGLQEIEDKLLGIQLDAVKSKSAIDDAAKKLEEKRATRDASLEINRRGDLEKLVTELDAAADAENKKLLEKFGGSVGALMTSTQEGIKKIADTALGAAKAIAKAFGFGAFTATTQSLEDAIAEARSKRDAVLRNQALADTTQPLDLAAARAGLREDIATRKKLDEDATRARLEEANRQIDSFTGSLTSAVGTAITDGILEGKKAMETLADVGAQLFRKFTDDAMANLQKGLTAAVKAVAGSDEVAGAFSGLFSALLGIAGGVISILQRKRSSSKSFNPVTGKIESTQPLRGIVAGPSSVAIAAVGEDLARALIPTNSRLDTMIGYLAKIAGGGKSGGGFSGFGYAGSVATT